ncbi:DUF2691 family protein [Bacillus sp. BGMRC 2118]|nr:DUF2691 family protein [Bacillus sp. BGMRC 2118]
MNEQNLNWYVSISETHPVVDGELENGDLFEVIGFIEGTELKKLLTKNVHYSVFLTLRGFPKNYSEEEMKQNIFSDLKGFLDSSCEFCLMIVDAGYFYVVMKDSSLVQEALEHFNTLEVENIKLVASMETWYIE